MHAHNYSFHYSFSRTRVLGSCYDEEQINSHVNALKDNGLYIFGDNIFVLSFIENLQFTFRPAHVHEIFRLYIK